jgi:hypothetical protein
VEDELNVLSEVGLGERHGMPFLITAESKTRHSLQSGGKGPVKAGLVCVCVCLFEISGYIVVDQTRFGTLSI